MTSSNELYYQKQANLDSQQLINLLTLFISYILLITLFIVLGIIGGIPGAALIGIGGVLMSGMFRYNQVNEEDKRSEKQTLLDEIKDLKQNVSASTEDESPSSDEHSHGSYSHAHPSDFPNGVDTNNLMKSTDSDNYGICDDDVPVYKKYLQRYELLDYGESGFNIPEDTAVKHIKITFKPHNMNDQYNTNDFNLLSGMVTSGDPTATVDRLPGVKNGTSTAYANDLNNGIVAISQIQVIQHSSNGDGDGDGLENIADKGNLSVLSGTTEVPVNSHENSYIAGNHVRPQHLVDGDINTTYFGGIRQSGSAVVTARTDDDGIMLTLAVAKDKTDLSSIIVYSPIGGSLKGAYIHLLNGNNVSITEQPIPFPSGNHHIYNFKFSSLGASEYINRFIRGDFSPGTDNADHNKSPNLYYAVSENINGLIFDTRQQYAIDHASKNIDNLRDCSDPNQEGFIARLSASMFGDDDNVTKKFKVVPVSNDLI